jgi:nucleoid-associated protein YgaU
MSRIRQLADKANGKMRRATKIVLLISASNISAQKGVIMAQLSPKNSEPVKKDQFKSLDSYVSMALGLAVVILIGALAYNFSSKKPTEEITKTAEQTTTESAVMKSFPTSYIVKAGDTLWTIAETFYKSGYNWVDIQKANSITNPNDISVGQTLTIPKADIISVGQISSTSTENLRPKDTQYTVIKGDSLWTIAEREYGSGYKWIDIARANKLTDPNIIHNGNVLQLP